DESKRGKFADVTKGAGGSRPGHVQSYIISPAPQSSGDMTLLTHAHSLSRYAARDASSPSPEAKRGTFRISPERRRHPRPDPHAIFWMSPIPFGPGLVS